MAACSEPVTVGEFLLSCSHCTEFVSAQCHPRPEMEGGGGVVLILCVYIFVCEFIFACSTEQAFAKGGWVHISYSNQRCPVGATGERFSRLMFLYRLIHLAVWIDGTLR